MSKSIKSLKSLKIPKSLKNPKPPLVFTNIDDELKETIKANPVFKNYVKKIPVDYV